MDTKKIKGLFGPSLLFLIILVSSYYIYDQNKRVDKEYNQTNLNNENLKLSFLSQQPEDFTVGSDNPMVRIVVYIDTDCPFCLRYEPRLQRLLEERPNDVSITYRNLNLPLYPSSKFEHQVLECVGILTDSETYVRFQNEYMLKRVSSESDSDYEELLNIAGLFIENEQKSSRQDLEECVSSPDTTARLKRKHEIGRLLGVRSTPTAFLVSQSGKVQEIIGSRKYEDLIQDLKNFEPSF